MTHNREMQLLGQRDTIAYSRTWSGMDRIRATKGCETTDRMGIG